MTSPSLIEAAGRKLSCAARSYQLVETSVEPGASATHDRRPEFQHTIEARPVLF